LADEQLIVVLRPIAVCVR